MYAIKIMSAENKPDSDVGKGFKMIMVDAGDTFEFGHDQHTGEPQVTVTGNRAGDPTCTTYPVTGNCYVLSETGKTIASFWGYSLWGRKQVRVELDPRDTDPDQTVLSIKSVLTKQFESRLKEYEERGLTENQLELIKNGPTKLPSNPDERDKVQRARTAYLISQGIPTDIATAATMYIVNCDMNINTPDSSAIRPAA